MTEWDIQVGPDESARIASSNANEDELLGDLIAMWTQYRVDETESIHEAETRQQDFHDYPYREELAAIARRYSDLSEREVLAIFGTLGPDVTPGYPPWEFSYAHERLRIGKDDGVP